MEGLLRLPLLFDLINGTPVPDGEAGEVACAHGRGLRDFGADDRRAENVRLELHHQVVPGGAAIDLEFGEADTGVAGHGLDDVHGLECDAFQGGAGDVGGGRAACQAADGAMGILVPVRGAHAGQRRDEIHPAVVRDGGGQRFHLGGGADDAESVAQPLDHAAADEDGAFQGVIDRVADLPGDGRQEVVLGENRLLAGIHQEEAAGPVGVLDRAGIRAELSEEGGLLVAGDTGDGHLVGEDGRLRVPIDLGGGADFGKHGSRNAEQFQQFTVPAEVMDVEQHGPGGVRDVGHMDLAAGKLPDEPGIDGAETELPGLCLLARAWDVLENPADLGAGEVRIDDQAGLFADFVHESL